MSKIDSKYQVGLPKDLMTKVNTNFYTNLCLYSKGKKLFFDNPSPENYHIPCIGKINLYKDRRFLLPQMARSIFNLNPGDEIEFFICDGKLAFRRIFTKK